MQAVIFFVFLISLLSVKVAATEPRGDTYKDCSNLDEVSYSPPSVVPIKERIVIERTIGRTPKISTDTKEQIEKYSPQRTAKLIFLERPNFMKEGPWNTKVMILGNEARPLSLTIEFIHHSSGGLHFEWLNEKLLFIQVWWGRIVSTDLVLDVETGKPIYLEEANYLRSILSCDEKRGIQSKKGRN